MGILDNLFGKSKEQGNGHQPDRVTARENHGAQRDKALAHGHAFRKQREETEFSLFPTRLLT